jgi:hypothetical protein
VTECPYCGEPAADIDAEIAHMEAAHPDVISSRLSGDPPEHDSTGTTPAYGGEPPEWVTLTRQVMAEEGDRARRGPLLGRLLYEAMRSVDVGFAQPPWEEITVQLATDVEAIAVRFGDLSNGLIEDAVSFIEAVAHHGDERSAEQAHDWLVQHGIYERPADDKE